MHVTEVHADLARHRIVKCYVKKLGGNYTCIYLSSSINIKGDGKNL